MTRWTEKDIQKATTSKATGWRVEKATIYIGIDTGTHTGIAIWNATKKQFERIATLPIHKAMDLVKEYYATHGSSLKVRYEDARLWMHHQNTDKGRIQGAGSIKRDGAIWEAFLTDLKVNYESVRPNNKITKLDKEQFARHTRYTGLTSNHGRDAAMLVYGF